MKTILKKTALILCGISFISLVHATKHTVSVQNFSFSPATFSASVGDTVVWNWAAGAHTTTSLTIPGGAAAWNDSITQTKSSFQYVITTAGTYNYQCNIHFRMGMTGSFTVTTTGIPAISNTSKTIAQIYPNPASGIVNIHLLVNPKNNLLIITDISGKEVVRETLTGIDNSIDISNWAKGVYFYRLKNDEDTMEGKFEVQ